MEQRAESMEQKTGSFKLSALSSKLLAGVNHG